MVYSIRDKLTAESNLAVLAFQDKVYNTNVSLQKVRTPASNMNIGEALSWINGRQGSAMDSWKLDIGEALVGSNEDVPWRDSVLAPFGAATANAKTLLGSSTADRGRRVAIMITDWYDGYVQGSSQGYDVRRMWGDYLSGFGYDMVNVILAPLAGSGTLASGATYLDYLFWPSGGNSIEAVVNRHTRALFEQAIGLRDIRVVGYDKIFQLSTAVMDNFAQVRENLLNEAYQINPGERQRLSLAVDSSIGDVGLLLFGEGLTHRLYKPDGSEVAVVPVGGTLVSQDPAVTFERSDGGKTDHFNVTAPEVGTWTVEIDGTRLTAPVFGRALAVAGTSTSLKAMAPEVVRPGAPFTVAATAFLGAGIKASASATLRLTRLGSVYEIGSRVQDLEMTGALLASGNTSFSKDLMIRDYEGGYPYRVLMRGEDGSGQEVLREASGEFFVQGDAPVIASPSPMDEVVDESPSISVLVADDVKMQGYSMRVDGRQVTVVAQDVVPVGVAGQFTPPSADWQPRQVKRLSGQVTWTLAPGEHTMEVTASDSIAQEAAPVPVSAVPADAPFDVAVDATGLIYTTCESTAAVLVYTRAGELVRTLAPTIDGRQVSYRSIDLDAGGNIYLSAPVLGKTVKLSPEGEYLQGFGKANLGAGGNLSSFISGGQVDGQGQVYLADRLSGLVYQFDAAGTWIGVTGPFSIPDCIKVDDEGLLFVGMPFGRGFVALAPSWPVEASALPEGPCGLGA